MWRQGRYEDAINYYFKLATITNKAMEDGKRWDAYVNEFAVANKQMPPEFGDTPLTSPRAQEKLFIEYNDQFDLVGVPDVLDDPVLYEIKTGSSKDSADYANDFQISLYFLLCDTHYPSVDRAYIKHYNQYSEVLDETLIWKTDRELARARNFIDSIGPDLILYWDKYNLWDRDRK